MTVTYYIDIEGVFPYDVVEVGVVCVSSEKSISFKKWLVKRLPYANQGDLGAQYCHCIPSARDSEDQVDYLDVQEKLSNFLNSHPHGEDAVVAGYGEDITRYSFQKYFPNVNISHHYFRQVDMPCWVDRERMWVHSVLRSEKSSMCSWHTLCYKDQRRKDGSTSSSQRARNKYGFHCALVDAFELAVIDRAISVWDIMVLYDMWYVHAEKYIKT